MKNCFYQDTLNWLEYLYFSKKQYLILPFYFCPDNKKEPILFEIPKNYAGFEVFLLEYKVQVMKNIGFDMSKTTMETIFNYCI